MGLFDSLLGNVNTSPIKRAGNIVQASYPVARGDITTGVGQATGTLTDAQKQAIAAQQAAEQQQQGYLGGALPAGMSYLQQGLQGGIGALQPLQAAGQQGIDMYGRLLGLGPGGQAGIQEALAATPGYQFALDQGIQGLDRSAASTGRYNPSDVMKYATGLAGQTYQNILGDFNPYFGMAQGAAGDIANLYSGFGRAGADLTASTAARQAAAAGDLGSNLSNLYTGTGGAVAGLQSGLGQQLAGLDLGQAQAKANTLANIFNVQQQAGVNAADFWGNLLGAGAGAAGRYFGG